MFLRHTDSMISSISKYILVGTAGVVLIGAGAELLIAATLVFAAVMAGCLMFSVSVITIYLHITLTLGTDLRESFYNELRFLLSKKPFVTENRKEKLYQVPNWGENLNDVLGQVSGVSVNALGQPVLLHRGNRVWNIDSFNNTNHYVKINEGRIPVDTVVTLDPNTGTIISKWGSNMFYLPHGITIDVFNNTWITDVAMHQVLKFYQHAYSAPTLRLGQLFRPGHDKNSLCKPTSVAVATNGVIFVADGYCNSRILKFRHDGELLRIYPHNTEFLSLVVPHGVVLLEKQDLLCIADRENMRVVCMEAELGHDRAPNSALAKYTIHQPDLGRVFAIAAKDGLVYAVNGPTSSHIPVQGFTIDPVGEKIIDHWKPSEMNFLSPHSLAISPDGKALYVSELGPNKIWKFKFMPVME